MGDTAGIPWLYRVFFLYLEPFSALVGAFYAHLRPAVYLELTDAASAAAPPPLAARVALSQLANLYLLFAFNEAVLLRCTPDRRVWRALLLGLLLADLGHLWSVAPLGARVYRDFWTWNAIEWGNVGFVYLGALLRLAFLSGCGLSPPAQARSKSG